jgi:molybdate transport system substrate-binding protein
MMRLLFFIVLAGSSLIAEDAMAKALTIAVAANVQYAFQDLQAAFTRETGIAVRPVIASSGKITAQVLGGAPFDIFLSADMEYPRTLYKEKLADSAPAVYAYGTLVLWTRAGLDLRPGLTVLADPKVDKVALANPKLAPYGRAAMQALAHYRLADAVRAKAIFGEDIAQVTQYVYTRNAAAGFTTKSAVLSPAIRGKGQWIEVPRDAYQPIAQGVAILKHGANSSMADCERFVHFLASAPARAILANYGYGLP